MKNQRTHTFKIKSTNSNVINVNIGDDHTPLSELLESFESFLLAIGYRIPDGAHIGYEWTNEPSIK